jgi:hypothetical protein
VSDYITTTRFAVRGFTAIIRDGLDRITAANRDAFENLEKLSALELNLAKASAEQIVSAHARVHVARYNAEHAKTLADFHRATLMDSVDAAATALLNVAKQGIVRVRGGLAECPPGRTIGKTPLRDVVWQARNQSNHCDEGGYSPKVVSTFGELEAEFGAAFHLDSVGGENLALMVVLVLGWEKDHAYELDMASLLRWRGPTEAWRLTERS